LPTLTFPAELNFKITRWIYTEPTLLRLPHVVKGGLADCFKNVFCGKPGEGSVSIRISKTIVTEIHHSGIIKINVFPPLRSVVYIMQILVEGPFFTPHLFLIPPFTLQDITNVPMEEDDIGRSVFAVGLVEMGILYSVQEPGGVINGRDKLIYRMEVVDLVAVKQVAQNEP
jgi:hypothetical protein